MPTKGLEECITDQYRKSRLCPAACLIAHAARTRGALPDQALSDIYEACTYHPVHTKVPATLRVRARKGQEFPLCIESQWGSSPVGQIEKHFCQSIVAATHPYVITMQDCNFTTEGCTPSPTGACALTVPDCLKQTIRINLPGLRHGTHPLADFIWYCGKPYALQTLPSQW